eukprot:jgi/Sobl393_1/6267/SZX77020.1
MCSSQTMAGSCLVETTSGDLQGTIEQRLIPANDETTLDSSFSSSCEVSAQQAEQNGSWLGVTGPAATYLACADMIRQHKLSERPTATQKQRTQRTSSATASSSNCSSSDSGSGALVDAGSRAVVVSWLVEVAEEFGLQQESLHAAVALLDRFLAGAAGVPRCVLQLVAVGCVFLATKQLEVRPPSVEQLVAVAAHSFSAPDLLRVERLLLDALEFRLAPPTPYGCLHLLTQATLAAMAMASTDQQQQPCRTPCRRRSGSGSSILRPLPPHGACR